MARKSEVFARMFSHKDTVEDLTGEVDMSEYSAEVIDNLINLLLDPSHARIKDLTEARKVYELGRKYMIEDVKWRAKGKVATLLDIESAKLILREAETPEPGELDEMAMLHLARYAPKHTVFPFLEEAKLPNAFLLKMIHFLD